MKKTKPSVCAYCGERPADTRDHVPPKSIFLSPLPNDLITVPACSACNRLWSRHDEKFRVMLSLRLGVESPNQMALWRLKSLPTVKHNRALYRELLARMHDVDMVTPGGLYVGRGGVIRWDAKAHDRMIERIARGLYFHHYNEALPRSIGVRAAYYSHLDAEMLSAFEQCKRGSVGGRQFVYAYGRPEELPTASIWLFQFHEGHWAGAHTDDDGLAALASEDAPVAAPSGQ